MTRYYAHSGHYEDKSDWQLLNDHLQMVAETSKKNARYFRAEELAYLAGLLHDLGKYSQEFQARLEGSPTKVDHATAGAKIAANILPNPWYKLVAYAIAGHHAGLANGSGDSKGRRSLKDRLNYQFGKELCAFDNKVWEAEITLPRTEELSTQLKPHQEDIFHGFQFSFLIRMIFSCLVDADYIDTDRFYKNLKNKPLLRGEYPQLTELKHFFDYYLSEITEKSDQSQKINKIRNEILESVRYKAEYPPGLFTLTVPTGGGKTLSSMAFALEHALMYQMRRVIYVIPFTSIIEQNAKVFRQAFADLGEKAVLEHHSNFDDRHIKNEESQDKLKLAMENWDMPVVVTTAVQFFESLFADRPSRCRKLHNITGSVVILDEAQTLPLNFLRPVMAAIDELARNYGCSVVLCTATQPALCKPDFDNGFENVREIAPNPNRLFDELSLVNVSHLGELSDDALITHITKNEQILVIVNNRRHAQSLFQALKGQQCEGIFHLTTLMCAAHRTQILNTIKDRLKIVPPLPCRVISTSLIEAGVDIDFPCVMRAEAGLDSIAQAAGRCNRERLRSKDESHVWIFKSPDWNIPPELDGFASGTRSVLRRGYDNLLSESAIKEYFLDVYWRQGEELDKNNILNDCHTGFPKLDFPFQKIASEFRMIDNYMRPIFIPYNNEAVTLISELATTDEVSRVLRKLQPFIVQIPNKGFESLAMAGAIQTIMPQRFEDQFWELINLSIYNPEFGISWSDPDFISVEKLIF